MPNSKNLSATENLWAPRPATLFGETRGFEESNGTVGPLGRAS